MKTYTFANESNSNIVITIKANTLIEAVEVLAVTVKYPEDFNQTK